jgi:Domain of unknown function (DUF1707)
MDMPAWNFLPDDRRLSAAERDQAIAWLSEHFQAGRLTREEFEELSGRALQARTAGELSVLFTGLPENTAAVPAVGGPGAGRPWRLSPGSVRGAGRRPTVSILILCVIAAIILTGALGHGHGHSGVGLLVLVVIAGFVILRRARRNR